MVRVTVTAVEARIEAGAVLALTHPQAAARAHRLTHLQPDERGVLVRVEQTVEFKQGETFGLQMPGGRLSKALLLQLDVEDGSPAADASVFPPVDDETRPASGRTGRRPPART